jgi:hypothetical protein
MKNLDLEYAVKEVRELKKELSADESKADAKEKLRQIYNSSRHYGARYEAAMALSVPEHELKARLKEWVGQLGEMMNARTMIERSEWYSHPYSSTGNPLVEECWTEEGPDRYMISIASGELNYLMDNLPELQDRKLAAGELGYSSIGFWLHDFLNCFRKS